MDKQIPEIPMNELRISTYSPTVRTGFSLRFDEGCRITHLPTRIEVSAENERSIHMAKAEAMKKFEKAWAEYWSKPTMNNRDAFEAWAEKELLPLDRRDSDHYRYDLTNRAWAGWQAALASQAQQQKEQGEPCTNSDSWNCKYCGKTKTCKAIDDDRNYSATVNPLPPAPDGDKP